MFRDNYTCQCCKAHGKGVKLHVHHRETRKTGGNAPDNLITLCDLCHGAIHSGKIAMPAVLRRASRSTRDATFMGIMRKTLIIRLESELLIPIQETHGYVTKYTRVELLKIPKTHANDALAIAMGRDGFNVSILHCVQRSRIYHIKAVRHHNRQLHKCTILKGGVRKSNQAPKYVKGFRLFDKVRYRGQECFIWGRRAAGNCLLKSLDGTKIKDGANCKHLALLERSSNYLIA